MLPYSSRQTRYAPVVVAGRSSPVANDVLPFWLPVVILTAVIFTVSWEYQYAASGGEELYGGTRVGSTFSRQVAFMVLGTMGLGLLVRQKPVDRKLAYWPILVPSAVLITYIHATILWSDDPTATLKRSIVLTCIFLAAAGVGKTWNYRQFSLGIFFISSLLLAASIAIELYYASFLSVDSGYRFSGIFHPAKQAFGCGMLIMSCISLLLASAIAESAMRENPVSQGSSEIRPCSWYATFVSQPVLSKRVKSFVIAIALVALAFLLLTRARTGVAATVIATGVLLWPHISMKKALVILGLGACLAMALVAYAGGSGRDLHLGNVATMGRDTDLADPTKLTGRLPIWSQAIELFSQRPAVGFGYGAFWTAERLREFDRRNGWELAHSHSSYVESLVNLGIVGFSMGLSIVVISFAQGVRLLRVEPANLIVPLLVMACVSGIAETAFVADGFEVVAITCAIGMLGFDARLSTKRAGY